MSSTTIIRARSLPYREPRPGTYTCQRCGIPVNTDPRTATGYCRDCAPEARALGWIPLTNHERTAA